MLTYATPSLTTTIDPNVCDAVPSTTGTGPVVSPVQNFCATHGIADGLRCCIGVAADVFALGGPIEVMVGYDPEIAEEFVVINVPVVGDADAIHRDYRTYLQRTRSLPAYVKSRIRLMVEPV